MSKAIYLDARDGDWDWAQVMFETTAMSTSDIGTTIGRSAPQVASKASRAGWVRDKGQQVTKMTAELIIANQESYAERKNRELEVIEKVNTEMQARVLVAHRQDIKTARNICMRLFNELSSMMDHPEHLQELGELLRAPNDRGTDRLNDAYHQVISFSSRTSALKKLGEGLKTLIMLERQAFGIQGLLEDPEAPSVQSDSPDPLGWDRVLTKFATVMAQAATSQAAKPLVTDISDVAEKVTS